MSLGKEHKMKLTKQELKNIKGGAGFSAALMNALLKGVQTVMDAGRYLGSSIRRLVGGNRCPLK